MGSHVGCVILVLVCIVGCTISLFEGDSCTYNQNGSPGVCVKLSGCPLAIAALRRGVTPQICAFSGTTPVVCCPGSTDSTVAPPPAEVTRKPFVATCPPLPPNALGAGVAKTGQKAWDKCIDLAETVYPCKNANTLGIVQQKSRVSQCDHVATSLIVGGTPANPGEFPHMALLGLGEEPNVNWDCGGTLISNKHILTAGHCVFKRGVGNVSFVRLGGKDVDVTPLPDELYSVAKIILHPQYTAASTYNDIAILELDREVPLTRDKRPACIHTGTPLNVTRYLASGWGTTASRGAKSDTLLKVILQSFTQAECAEKNPPNRKAKEGVREATQLCAGHRTEKKDTCQGDSGGPLQVYNNNVVDCTYLIVGVVSNGRICAVPGQPAIYTRVSAFVPWIESVVWPN